ncbi:MAG: YbaB/EbfC family nucleoid-associated protein [Thermomicrobiales bacterium]
MQPSMKMIQQMQNRLAKIQQELEDTEIEGSAGGGAVKVIVNGQREFRSISIDPEFVDPDDVEMLEETIAAAISAGPSSTEAGRRKNGCADRWNEDSGPRFLGFLVRHERSQSPG